MLQATKILSVEEIHSMRLKGAIYIRMSTELQSESPELQEKQIRSFADSYGIEIVKVYADLGISGMTARDRKQFMALIDDVNQGLNEFTIVLYLDESRWGRFVDSRMANYFRVTLNEKNVTCHPCDKPLVLSGDPIDHVVTFLKDMSASDYCRQLSQKVWMGQCNLVEKGFRQGGVAGYGLRRMLLDDTGERKQELIQGQRKSLLTERVILVPGPKAERQIVVWIYDQFRSGITETQIAEKLNSRGIKNHMGRLWSRSNIYAILTNEKYIGNNVFNRISAKMKQKATANPENEWIRKEQAFEPIVDKERFYAVQEIYHEKNKKISNEELLRGLKDLYAQRGRLSAMIIDETDSLPSSSLFQARFGGLLRAYRLIGYTPERDYQYVIINKYLRILHANTVAEVVTRIENLCNRKIHTDCTTGLLELNNHLFISIVICRCFTSPSGTRRWKIRFDTGLHPDITIAVRMDAQNATIQDYYILPALEFSDKQLKLSVENSGFLDSFRTDSLEYLFNLSINISLDSAVKNGTTFGSAYSS